MNLHRCILVLFGGPCVLEVQVDWLLKWTVWVEIYYAIFVLLF